MSEIIPNFVVVADQPDQKVEDSFGPVVEVVSMAPLLTAAPEVTVV